MNMEEQMNEQMKTATKQANGKIAGNPEATPLNDTEKPVDAASVCQKQDNDNKSEQTELDQEATQKETRPALSTQEAPQVPENTGIVSSEQEADPASTTHKNPHANESLTHNYIDGECQYCGHQSPVQNQQGHGLEECSYRKAKGAIEIIAEECSGDTVDIQTNGNGNKHNDIELLDLDDLPGSIARPTSQPTPATAAMTAQHLNRRMINYGGAWMQSPEYAETILRLLTWKIEKLEESGQHIPMWRKNRD